MAVTMSRVLAVRINGGVLTKVESGTVGVDTKWDNTSTNDSGKFEDEEPISETMVLEGLSFVKQTNVNPHAAPLRISNLTLGNTILLEVFPEGVAAGLHYYAPTFAVKNYRGPANPKEGGHQSVSFSGNSISTFYKPGEAHP